MVDGIITQGSTPWQAFDLPDCFKDKINKATVTFAQRGVDSIVKKCAFSGGTIANGENSDDFYYEANEARIWVRLHENETLRFRNVQFPVQAQLKILTTDENDSSDVFVTRIYTLRVMPALDTKCINQEGQEEEEEND